MALESMVGRVMRAMLVAFLATAVVAGGLIPAAGVPATSAAEPSPTLPDTGDPTPEPSVEPTATLELTPAPSVEPTATPDPSPELTPELTPEPTTTADPTLTPAPTLQPTPGTWAIDGAVTLDGAPATTFSVQLASWDFATAQEVYQGEQLVGDDGRYEFTELPLYAGADTWYAVRVHDTAAMPLTDWIWLQYDGSVTRTYDIALSSPAPTGTPEWTPNPTAQPSPEPSMTPDPSLMPEPTATLEPTATPQPTPQPSIEPTSTPDPSSTDRLPEAGRIFGAVFDAYGQPVEGARVHTQCHSFPCTDGAESYSDATGQYLIEGLEDAEYGLYVQPPTGATNRYVTAVTIANSQHSADIHLGGNTLAGTISGLPAGGFVIQACGPSGNAGLAMHGCEVRAIADDGTYSLPELPDGSHDIWLMLPDSGMRLLGSVHLSGATFHEFNFMVAQGSISGHVVDHLGQPVAGAYVVLCGPANPNCDAIYADASGGYEFAYLPGGEYALRAANAEWRWGFLDSVIVADGAASTGNDIVIAAGTVDGTVTDAAGPIAGAWVSLCYQDDGGATSCYQDDTDEAGRFAFSQIASGDYDLRLSVPGWADRSLGTLTVGAQPVIHDIFVAGVPVTVRVVDEFGNPIADASAFICHEDTYCSAAYATDAAGEATITRVPPGSAILHVGPPANSGLGSAHVTVDVADEPIVRELTLLNDGSTIRTVHGYVYDQHGTPVRGAFVHISDGGPTDFEITTDDSGYFLADGLSPANFSVCAYDPERTLGTCADSTDATHGDVFAEIHIAGYTYDPTLDAGALHGYVYDRSGAPVAGARVEVYGDATGTYLELTADADGHYDAGALAGGWYTVWAYPPDWTDYTYSSVRVDGTLAQLDLTLPNFGPPPMPTNGLHGQVTDEDGEPVAWIQVEICDASGLCDWRGTDSSGRYVSAELEPGSFTITAHPYNGDTAKYLLRASVVVEFGGGLVEQNVVLPRAPLITVEGTASYSDGQPVVGASVAVCFVEAFDCHAASPLPSGVSGGVAFATTDQNGFYSLSGVPVLDEPARFAIRDFDNGQNFESAPEALVGPVHVHDFSLERHPGGIDGLFVYDDGTPVAGGEVYWLRLADSGDGEASGYWPMRPTSDSGTFAARHLAPGTYQLSGYDARSRTHAESATFTIGTAIEPVELRLPPLPTGGFAGTVYDSLGNPVPFAQIEYVYSPHPDAGAWGQATADANGYYEVLFLNPTAVQAWVYPPDYSYAEEFQFEVADTVLPRDFVLAGYVHEGPQTTPTPPAPTASPTASPTPNPTSPPPGAIEGYLTYEDGTPLGGVSMAVRDLDWNWYDTQTQSDGFFRFSGLPADEYLVWVFPNDRAYPSDFTFGEVSVGSTVVRFDVSIPLPPAGSITGTITSADGSQLDTPYVMACSPTYDCVWAYAQDGSYLLSGMPAGAWRLTPFWSKDGTQLQGTAVSVDVASAQLVHDFVVATPTGSLSGRITETDGSPYANQTVHLCGFERCGGLITDADGYYAATMLAAGEYQLVVYPDNGGSIPDPAGVVTVGDGPVTRDIVLPGGAISGTVFADGTAATGGWLQACSSSSCFGAAVGSDGSYRLARLPAGSYSLTGYPSVSGYLPTTLDGAVTVGADEVGGVDLTFQRATPPPTGTTITGPSASVGDDGVPLVNSGEALTLSTTGCVGGVASYTVTSVGDPTLVITGDLIEVADGSYEGSVTLTFGGAADVRITVSGCPDPADDGTVAFNIYIDPSGWVRNTRGAPIVGATVILYRADTPHGPWLQVPDGSDIMDPKNRTNPDLTDDEGHFGWDVVAGYYKVRTQKAGCVDPADAALGFVETRVYEIPPPVMDIDLRLYCGEQRDATAPLIDIATPIDGARYELGTSVVASYTCTDETGGTGVASCTGDVANGAALDTASVGPRTLTVTATDAVGNVSQRTVSYSVVYRFALASPLAGGTTLNRATAGSNVPVKFSLGGDHGLSVLASGSPTSRQVNCSTLAPTGAATAITPTLRYDSADDRYSFIWSTDRGWAGSCRQVSIALVDGTEHLVHFEFPRKGR